SYSGDRENMASSGSMTQNVRDKTKTTITGSAPNPSRYGQPVTYTATVAPTTSGLPAPSGTVTFKSGTTTLVTKGLTNGTTSATSAVALPPGSDAVTATYNGSSVYESSTSSPFTQLVQRTNTTTGLSTAAANQS